MIKYVLLLLLILLSFYRLQNSNTYVVFRHFSECRWIKMIGVDRWQNLFPCHYNNKRRALDSNFFVIVIYYDQGSGCVVSHSLSFFSKLLSVIDVCMHLCVLLLPLSLSLPPTMDIRSCRTDSAQRKKIKYCVRCMKTNLFFFDSLINRVIEAENEE